MARTNFEIVERAVAAITSEDERRAAELFAPDAEWHNTPVFPGERVCRGVAEIIEHWRKLSEDFERGGVELEDHTERGPYVAVGFHSWGRGKASGVPLDVRWGATFELRERRIVCVRVHGTFEKAVAAAGR